MITFLSKLFGNTNDRFLKPLYQRVEKINALEPRFESMSDDELRGMTDNFRTRLEEGETEDDILEEAFAVVREASKRTLGMRPYDVQLIGGMVLHQGRISEMKTGEGKTLVATMPVYLNAISGKGVHLVTVNDYLAERDAEWMSAIYNFLGLTVGTIIHGKKDQERRDAYNADITYGTNNEFGFDYLRDNMKFKLEDMVQRDFNYIIIDEVDSILIDEARTPLIISGPAADSSENYIAIDSVIPELNESHYEIDEKTRSTTLTDDGVEFIEDILRKRNLIQEGGLYDVQNMTWLHHINQALRAHKSYARDVDYMITPDNKVAIIDEFTGRMMEGRRYSEGLHQAIEAKEKVQIQRENQTLASVTYQNYFRLYPKIGGMTGTALTEEAEFAEIYGLEVIEIPTNTDITRIDNDDIIYRTIEEKDKAVVERIRDCQEKKQPVLVGTVSIEKSEHLSKMLKKAKIKHNVLNARYHDQEAQIIGQAGVPGTVTIATNMAGRGTDIQLGGNAEMRIAAELPEDLDTNKREAKEAEIIAEVEAQKQIALEAGGLAVLASERHESRRIDNQLRGRSGRQGDPGETMFYISLQDDLMRIFASDKMGGLMQKLGLKEDEALTHPWLNTGVERAQKKVEAHHFEIRKNLLKFDNVMNDQRREIYAQRREIMESDSVADIVADMRHEVIEEIVTNVIPKGSYSEQWDMDTLELDVQRSLGLKDAPIREWAEEDGISSADLEERIKKASDEHMAEKAAKYGSKMLRTVEKSILLQLLDQIWKEHLLHLDHLRQGIGLRAYAQRDPLNEYKAEAFDMFVNMLAKFREVVTAHLSNVEIQVKDPAALEPQAPDPKSLKEGNIDPAIAAAQKQQQAQQMKGALGAAPKPAISRNAPCPCGSGKKYKHCHGRVAQKAKTG